MPENGVTPTIDGRDDAIIDERQLIEKLLNRQPAAWNELIVRYQRLIYAQVLRSLPRNRLAPDDSTIDDIVAEVFAGLLTNDMSTLKSFRGKCKLSTCLAVIAQRTCWKCLAKLPRELTIGTLSDSNLQLELGVAAEEDALAILIEAENSDELREKLEMLKPADKRILEMHYKEQLDYREIGKQMGITINAVGPKLSRAHHRLRELLRST